ncbi:hypothetical protein AKJ09_06909 [Labilithrix luteola]|uniref:Uncharacterized protein n=1 Tax=Labilithrix luteola TaxID=1391654 RepID=A0A0K1Q349_9BACT|nr:hypothetical protein AKJ09_06909 [Labilithrix luteola]
MAVASRNGRSSVVIYEQGAWKVIHEVPFILTSVWASKTDVWVSGGEAGYVAHGRREGTDWKWTVRPIAVTTPVSVVRGIGEHEIYALADARVWHLEGAGDDWTIDFGGDVPADEAKFVSLVGTSPDDIWVTGVRGSYPPCGVVAHKSAGVWQTVIEGTPDEPSDFGLPSCVAVGSAVPMTATVGVATATAPRELVAITEGFFANSVARIRLQADGGVDIASSPFSYAMWVDKERRSIWGTSSDDLYLAGFSKVNRGHDIFADTSGDAGVWQISTVAFTGIALMKPFHVVRGTRSDNVWLAGESYVFHKTTN